MLAAAFAVTVQAQTNGVKISALTSAATPLSGSEIVPLVQSGATKTATVSQIIAAAISQGNAASNYFTLVTGTNAAALAAASNYLALVVGTNAASSLAASNYLSTVTVSNTAAARAYTLGVSNTITAALASYYPTSNPSGFQNAGQVSAAATAAVATYSATGITNGGTATLSNVVYAVKDNGSVPVGNTFTVDLAAASLQVVTVTNAGSLSNFQLAITNLAAGQNVTLLIKIPSAAVAKYVLSPAGCLNLSGGTVTAGANKSVLANFTTLGTVNSAVICGLSVQQ